MKSTQLKLFKEKQQLKCFGGAKLRGKRKNKRPLSTKLPTHLVLRANHKLAPKVFGFHQKQNKELLLSLAKKHNIRIYRFVFNWSHMHLLMLTSCRKQYNAFIREFSSKLAHLAGSTFCFEGRPYTRILNWGREYQILQKYMNKNWLEAAGGIAISWGEIPAEFAGAGP